MEKLKERTPYHLLFTKTEKGGKVQSGVRIKLPFEDN